MNSPNRAFIVLDTLSHEAGLTDKSIAISAVPLDLCTLVISRYNRLNSAYQLDIGLSKFIHSRILSPSQRNRGHVSTCNAMQLVSDINVIHSFCLQVKHSTSAHTAANCGLLFGSSAVPSFSISFRLFCSQNLHNLDHSLDRLHSGRGSVLLLSISINQRLIICGERAFDRLEKVSNIRLLERKIT